MIWQIKQSLVRIAIMNLFSMKVNRLSTKKKDSKTNHKGALTVEQQKSSRWEIGAVVATAVEEIGAAAVVGGKLKESKYSPFQFLFYDI